jgi:hypothetical protein
MGLGSNRERSLPIGRFRSAHAPKRYARTWSLGSRSYGSHQVSSRSNLTRGQRIGRPGGRGGAAGGAASRRAIPAVAARRNWPISVIWALSCTRLGPREGSRYRESYGMSRTMDRDRVEALHGGGRHGVAGERRGAVLARVWTALHTVPHQRDPRNLQGVSHGEKGTGRGGRWEGSYPRR